MSVTPRDLARLATKTTQATEAQKKAVAKLAERDNLAADLADKGARYQDLADAMGITTDGVTYVLRKIRKGRADTDA